MKLNWIRTTTVCLAVVAFMACSTSLMAQGKGKGNGNGNGGGGSDPPPSQAPVEYQLTLFGESEQQIDVRNMNSAGQVVGDALDANGGTYAFVWHSSTGIVDLNDIANVPAGWHLLGARGINSSGQIAGQARNLTTAQLVAFRYEPTSGDVEIMETFSAENHLAGFYDPINESGDVLYFSAITGSDGFASGGSCIRKHNGRAFVRCDG